MGIYCPKCRHDNPNDADFCGRCGAALKTDGGFSETRTLAAAPAGFEKGTTVVDRYRIIEELGRGGMGVVYKAEDTRLQRSVALKFLPPELTHVPEVRERFMHEARAAAALDHPHICTVYEFHESDERSFISMACIDGQSLKERIESGPLELEDALRIAAQAAEGLQAAHRKGIVHRDIKSGNIMIDSRGRAKIMDFGLARMTGRTLLTQAGSTMGTVSYMSPEQARGDEVDHRTDIWSWGVVLYEMLTGRLPYAGEHEQAVIYAILNSEPAPMAHGGQAIPAAVEFILETCLRKNPNDRYPDMAALLTDLRRVDETGEARAIPAASGCKQPPSIAVLPFVDMSPELDQEYFCDGLAEELINSLTRIRDIKVVARTSAFAFKGKTIDVRHIGRKLNVENVLEGSVRKAGNRLRITAQLINVADGYHLWSEKYDREMEDIFAIQDEISLAITDNLKVKLLKKEEKALLKRYTDNHEAYNLYLKGIYFLRKYTGEGFQEAIKYFELTLQKDPGYALAYYGLSEVYYAISYWANVPPHDAYPKAREFALKAVEIDREIGEAHASLGLVSTFYDWDWTVAERELTTALDLNPSSAIIHLGHSWFLSLAGRHEEAVAAIKRAQELDPLSPLIIAHIGLACIWAGRFDQAIDELKSGIALAPDFYLMHYYLGMSYRAKYKREEAIAEYEKAVELSGGAPWPALILATNYFETDRIDKGESLLENLKQRADRMYMPSLGFAYIYFVRGDLETTYHWVEKACEERDSFLPWCAIIPIEEYQLTKEPKIEVLFKKYGLM